MKARQTSDPLKPQPPSKTHIYCAIRRRTTTTPFLAITPSTMLQVAFVPPWKHVFRSLLREAAYLPDPIARRYMRSYILESYHFHWPHVIPNSSQTPHGQVVLERRARQLLSILRRANEGYIKPLERVLMLSYARIGRRRYELLEPYFGMVHSAKPKYKRDPGPTREMPHQWSPTVSLRLLIESQSLNAYVKASKVVPVIRAPYPPPDTYTKSGKLIPRDRIMQKWYYSLIERVLPPLPNEEWHTLHELIVGTEPWELPERRKRVRGRGIRKYRLERELLREYHGAGLISPPQDQNKEASYIDSADSNKGNLEDEFDLTINRNALTPEFIVFGPQKGHTFRPYVRGRPHQITRRFMTTLWNRIIQLTPRFEFAENVAQPSASSPQDSETESTERKSSEQENDESDEESEPKQKGKRTESIPAPSSGVSNRFVVLWGKPEVSIPVYHKIEPASTDSFFGGVSPNGQIIDTRKKSNKPGQRHVAHHDMGERDTRSL